MLFITMQNKNQPTSILIISILMFFCSHAFSQSALDYEKALKSFNQENFDDAYIYLKNALQDKPSHLQSKLMMADILLRRNQTRAAIIEYQESLLLGADLDIAYLPLAQAYSRIMEYEKVIRLLTNKLSANNNFEISILQAIAYENLERFNKALEKYENALELQPKNITALNNLASFYLRQDNIVQSKIFIIKALNVNPGNPFTLHIKGQINEKEGHIQKALALFKEAYIILPTAPFISRSLANTYVSLKQLDKARDVVDKILIITPDEPFIMLLSARLYGMNDNNELAVKAYEEITKKMALIPNEQLLKQSELLLVSGLALYMTGNYETARSKLINYVSQNPESLYAIGILVDTHIRLDESKVALKVMETHYDIIKNNLSLSLVLCDLYIQTNKIHQCQRFITELRKNHNAKRVFDLMQVKILQARNKHQKALSYFEQHFTNATGQEVKKVAVMLYLQNGQKKRALGLVNELIELVPGNLAYQLLKVEVLIRLQQFQDAQKINSIVLAANLDIFSAKYNQANLYYLKKEYQQAHTYAENLLKENAYSFRLYVLQGNILLSLGKLEKAKDKFTSAKLFNRENVIPYEKIISIYQTLKDFPSALKELDRLQKSHFLDPKYILLRANIYIQQHALEQAAEQYVKLYIIWSKAKDHQQLLYLGQQQRIAKIYDDAETTLLRALELLPNYLYAKIELMRLYINIGEITKAEAIISSLPQKIQKNSNIQVILGDVAQTKNQLESAQIHYLTALNSNNNYRVAVIKLYNLAKDKNMGTDKFVSTLEGIIDKYPTAYFHRHILADFFYYQGDTLLAKQHYLVLEKVAQLPRIEYIYNNLASMLTLSDPNTAMSFINNALEINQSNPIFIDTKGWILTQQGQYIEGLDLLREAFSMNSNHPSIQYHIAYNLVKSGQLEAARQELKKVLTTELPFAEKDLAQALMNSI